MNQIDEAIQAFGLLKPADKIVVGLSGGADSVTLTHYLKFELGCEVIACHVNHGLRGEESDRDMAYVEWLCEQWNIPLYIKSVSVRSYAYNHAMTVEEAGRSIRYATFLELLNSQKADSIATAHTLSDNVETVLLNLTRGTGLKGLCGIPAKRGAIIRPLIYCTRADVEEYCRLHELTYVTDSSNLDSTYSRNNVRNNVIPVLKQINPGFEAVVARSIKNLANDENYLQNQTDSALFFCKTNGAGYDIGSLRMEDVAIRNRVIARILEENKVEKSAGLIDEIASMIFASAGKLNVSGNQFVQVNGDRLVFGVEREPIPYFEWELLRGEYRSPAGELFKTYLCDGEGVKSLKKVYKNLLYLAIDYDKIKGKLVVRQRKAGDEIEFSHREGTKTLKKLFIDEKMTAYEKSKTPIIADDEGVLAVFGLGVSKRAAPDENTLQALIFQKAEESSLLSTEGV